MPPAHVRQPTGPKRNRLPVVDRILDALNHMDELESTRSAAVAHHLAGVEGFEVPSWEARMDSVPDHVTRKIVNLEDFINLATRSGFQS